MIRNSFIILDRIGQRSEKRIWEQGITDWDDFIDAKRVGTLSPNRKGHFDRQLLKAKAALKDYDSAYFSQRMKLSNHYRLYDHFREDACFLDIETSGYYGDITVIGIYDGNETRTMVRGFNMDKRLLQKELSKYKLLVTFNGSSFDIPVIRKYFGNVVPAIPHIDLRHVCSRVGLTGGLKEIEKKLSIRRAEEVSSMTGEDAVYLWQQYRATGEKKYLDLLVQYNEEDIINLKPLAETVIKKLWAAVIA